MNINKAAAAVCSAAILMFTASCSAGSMEMSEAAETISEAVSEKTIISAGNTKEVSYMKKYKDIISEMPSDGIAEKRNGVTYPEFQKLTYYSKTAERDTPVNVLLPSGYSEKKKYPVQYVLHGYFDYEVWMARETGHISEKLT
ncbi:MAG: esterase family protein, partial [Oscillospiraceae bacterium]|nr:esterase family protein [Oscillospiraceae bacterium]